VAIQTLFETQRFGLTHRLLRDVFGDLLRMAFALSANPMAAVGA
jgi:hypothetical protein